MAITCPGCEQQCRKRDETATTGNRVEHAADDAGTYALTFDGGWDRRSYRRYAHAPSFDLEGPDVQLVDLTGDGVTDVAVGMPGYPAGGQALSGAVSLLYGNLWRARDLPIMMMRRSGIVPIARLSVPMKKSLQTEPMRNAATR